MNTILAEMIEALIRVQMWINQISNDKGLGQGFKPLGRSCDFGLNVKYKLDPLISRVFAMFIIDCAERPIVATAVKSRRTI